MTKLKKFGTFGGVFTPTLLTILGVIMYLRLGWVVGNAGLLGAWVIILLSFLISFCTALSMSSITSNIRIGAGGAYAIISQSLGLEIGGSLGIPRYISQGLAVTMYIFGFREGWLSIFPYHSPFLVDMVVFILLFAIAYKSADLAIRTQYIIMGIIAVSLVTIVMAAYHGSMTEPTGEVFRFGSFPGSPENNFSGSDFWTVFAVFFPASTGIMAGANMSGELKNPQRSIPLGTLWAIGVSLVIYLLLAYWIALSAGEEELVSNYNVMIDKSFWPPAVIAGVLGATFSSALASIVGSSRILFAMGAHNVLPASDWLKQQNKTGQPRNAMIVTGLLVFLTMLIRDLNAIAPLVTMFFLITYAMLNVVVLIEHRLGLISFRPVFKVHPLNAWIGLIGSVIAMFIINPTISLISVAVVIAVYAVLSRIHLETPFEDVRSGLFVAFAEWAAKQTAYLSQRQQRAWKPNIILPVTDPQTINGIFSFLKEIAYPKGSIQLMGIGQDPDQSILPEELKRFSQSFQSQGVFSTWTVINTETFSDGVIYGNQALRGAFFKPNIIFLNALARSEHLEEFTPIIREAGRLELGLLVFFQNPRSGFGQKQCINIWIHDRSPNWEIERDIGNLDLSILVAYKLKRNWNARIRLITLVRSEGEQQNAMAFMEELIDLARLPETDIMVESATFYEFTKNAPLADLNVFGLTEEPDYRFMKQMMRNTDTSCLFVQDSGYENVLA